MRKGLFLTFVIGAALALSGCGLFGDDNSNDLYSGGVIVGLTDNVPASGAYVIQNIYNPGVRNIIAIVQLEDAKVGQKVEGQWYQMHVFQAGTQQKSDSPANGTLVTKAGFEVKDTDIKDSKIAGGRVTLTPGSPLPEDSYELRVYVDGKLAKVQPFVVSTLVPGPITSGGGAISTPQATPVRTSTPSR